MTCFEANQKCLIILLPLILKKCRRFKAKTGRLTNYQRSARQGLDTARCISPKFKKLKPQHLIFSFIIYFLEKQKTYKMQFVCLEKRVILKSLK